MAVFSVQGAALMIASAAATGMPCVMLNAMSLRPVDTRRVTWPPLITDDPSFGSVSATAPAAIVFDVVVPFVGFTVNPSLVSSVVAAAGDKPAIDLGMLTCDPGPSPKYQPVIPAAAASTAITRKIASPRPRRFCETRASAD